jgi:hypothetical protein
MKANRAVMMISKSNARLLAVFCAMLLVIFVMTGCGGKTVKAEGKSNPIASPSAPKATTNIEKTTETNSTAANKASGIGLSKTTPPTTTKAIPKLIENTFTLTLADGQNYTENTIPIYIKADQIIHINWLVIKGSDHFHMTFSLPDGNIIAVGNTGNLYSCRRGEINRENLTKNGDLVFRPSDNDWQDGYYLFHPQLQTNDLSVTVKIIYWIE